MAGETKTVDSQTFGWKPHGKGAVGCLAKSFEVATTEIQVGDLITLGALPDGAMATHLVLKTDDLDTGTEALKFDVLIGSTVVIDALIVTTTKAGTTCYFDFQTCSGNTLVKLRIDTAAATAAAGTINAALFYVGT